MYKFSYMDNGERVDKEFKSYFELLYFVAAKNVKDDEFISMSTGEETIYGMSGLIEKAKAVAIEGMIMEDMIAAESEDEEDSYEDFEEEDFEEE